MLLLTIAVMMLALRLIVARVIPWKLMSISSMNFAGILLFIVVGLEMDDNYTPVFKVGIALLFYSSVLLGEIIADRAPIRTRIFATLEFFLMNKDQFPARLAIFLYLITSFATPLQWALSNQSVTVASASDVKVVMAERGQSAFSDIGVNEGIEGLVRSMLLQFTALGLIGLGVGLRLYRKSILFLLAVSSVATYLTTAFDARSGFAISMSMLLLAYYLTAKRKLAAVFVLAAGCIVILALLEFRMNTRSGLESDASLDQRVEQLFSKDFAYGGLALDCLQHGRESDTALRYIQSHAALIVPRFLWPEKPLIAPNHEMTAFYLGAAADRIVLFTPLGEALFYFGIAGAFFVGLVYGLTAGVLERFYSSSPIFLGFLIELYVWVFLGYRHTYNNLFLALVLPKVYPLAILYGIALFSKRHQISHSVGRRIEHRPVT